MSDLKNREVIYNNRTWLNGYNSPFTGSVVCHLSKETDKEDKTWYNAFIELGGCHDKARIHHDWDNESLTDYINKVELLRNEIDNYLLVLKQNS